MPRRQSLVAVAAPARRGGAGVEPFAGRPLPQHVGVDALPARAERRADAWQPHSHGLLDAQPLLRVQDLLGRGRRADRHGVVDQLPAVDAVVELLDECPAGDVREHELVEQERRQRGRRVRAALRQRRGEQLAERRGGVEMAVGVLEHQRGRGSLGEGRIRERRVAGALQPLVVEVETSVLQSVRELVGDGDLVEDRTSAGRSLDEREALGARVIEARHLLAEDRARRLAQVGVGRQQPERLEHRLVHAPLSRRV